MPKAVPLLSRWSPLARGAAGEGTISAGHGAEHVRQQTDTGLLTPEQAALSAGSGFVTGAITHGSGSLDIDTALAGGGLAGQTTKGRARRIAEGALMEGLLEEAPQSAQEQAAQNLALGKPVGKGVPAAATAGGVVGFALGGGLGLVAPREQAGNPAAGSG